MLLREGKRLKLSGRSIRRASRKDSIKLGLSKRRKFLLVAILLSLFLLFLQGMPPEKRLLALSLFFVVSYVLSAWSLFKDLNGIEWLTNLLLPSLFPVSVGLFYYLLPQEAVTRFIVAVVFAIGMYALLLTANIFSVASIRTIQLLRAARAVGFLLTIVTSAFLFHVILSLRLGTVSTVVLVFVVCIPLFLQGLWSSLLEDRIDARIAGYTLVSSIIVAQLTAALSFWLVDVAMGSIFLAMVVYVLLGIYQHELEDRLFKKTMQEYAGFGLIVFLIVVVSVILRW